MENKLSNTGRSLSLKIQGGELSVYARNYFGKTGKNKVLTQLLLTSVD
jgi:hypothetical protein